MVSASLYRMLADAVLALHLLVVLFVVLGLLVVLLGRKRWPWVRNPWFRSTHLLAIAVVILQAWLGRICPLTTLEMALRERAGDAVYAGSFIAHWMQNLLYFDAPIWVFAVVYTVFGVAVLFSWFLVKPRSFS